MKIGIICYNLGWQTGGPRLIFSTALAWKKMGHQVVIYCPDFKGEFYKELWEGLDIRVVPGSSPLLWEYESSNLLVRMWQKFKQARLQNEIARNIAQAMDADFDLVNYHDFAYKVAPEYRRKNPNAAAIWTMNDPPYMYLPKKNPIYDIASRLFNWYADRSARHDMKSIDQAVVLVELTANWLRERGLMATPLWCGIDFEKFYQPVKAFAEPKKTVTLLGVGAFNKYRRYDDIVKAGGILRKQGYDARVILVCKDMWNAHEDKKEILAITRDVGMEPYVDFRWGGATEEELQDAYRASDVYVVVTHLPPPRNGYSWGLAVLEGIAAGLPAIITNTNDIKEALRHNETALFVDPYAPDQIAEQVRFLLDNPKDYERIATAGQKLVKEHMAWDVYAAGYLKLMEDFKKSHDRS